MRDFVFQALASVVRASAAIFSPWWVWVIAFCIGIVLIAEFA